MSGRRLNVCLAELPATQRLRREYFPNVDQQPRVAIQLWMLDMTKSAVRSHRSPDVQDLALDDTTITERTVA